MIGKVFAGIVMGLIVAILATIVFGIGSGGGESGGRTGLWAAGIGFLLTLFLAVRAERTRYAWGRGMLLSGLLCFAMPLASVVFSGIVGSQAMGQQVSEAGKAGVAIGTALGGTMLTVVSGFFGFFLGVIFLVGAFFALRRT